MIAKMSQKDEKIREEDIVVADMSYFRKKKFHFNDERNDQETEPLKGKNLAAFISGALSATLLIWLIYVIGLGLAVLVIYLLCMR